MTDMRTPLARARNHGSAKEGNEHWWMTKLTAIALVPLSFWFVWACVHLVGADHAAFAAFLGTHGNGLMMVLFVATAFYHLALGLQVVIEDYVHVEWQKIAALVIVKFGCVALGASCVIAVLRLAFGG
ncbi:MAG: succinate dehydrogenase, hydrophobic membrane anchor protein [Rhodobacterales bacterium]|nr:succinate dehydrogenase, hydrophobic membrane anchor protein [Rhodobacterales bacterium]